MSETTCWSLIGAAAAGNPGEREEFVLRYGPIVRAYVGARWRGSPILREADDVVQEVLLECFREGGALARAEQRRPGGFRAFLYGVTRNVTSRAEEKKGRRRDAALPTSVGSWLPHPNEEDLGRVFDRAWAKALMREAGDRLEENARGKGEAAAQRVRLLRERFQEGKPIRAIASEWEVDPTKLHTQFAQARKEFALALWDVVAFHSPGSRKEIDDECRALLSALA